MDRNVKVVFSEHVEVDGRKRKIVKTVEASAETGPAAVDVAIGMWDRMENPGVVEDTETPNSAQDAASS